MRPSRELDTKVAIEVMGWPATMHPLSRPVPLYSTDIAAAWTVDKPGWLWEFKETPKVLIVTLYTSSALRHKATAMHPVAPAGAVIVWQPWLNDKAATYALARCRAALEAVGAK